MEKRRDKLNIILSILESIKHKGGSSRPTNVMYKSNLSHKRMIVFIHELEEKGIIEIKNNKDKKEYCLTKKGYELIEEIKRIKTLSDAFGI
ncbi:winged helix-turn-helix transcriptional regulator [Candidatus Woesearchaeota archaeon]|nr:winged helix-turn-helix transcriptional regulator [Candidatus Woesearchaeota archaeon]